MTEQLDLLTKARDQGEAAGKACAAKARQVSDFDLVAARRRALELLAELGPMSGEALVERLKGDGFHVHDDRAFGPVFGWLSKHALIRCISYCPRKRGHGTAGGRVWAAA